MNNNYSLILQQYPVLNREQEEALMLQAKSGDEDAFTTLVLSNFRLVMDTAKNFKGMGFEEDDLYQQGIIGMEKAIADFDITRGGRLSTYAIPKIECSIREMIHNEGRTVRIPENVIKENNKINKAYDEFVSINGYEPDNEQLSEFMNDPKFTPQRILDVRVATQGTTYLDSPITTDEEESATILDSCASFDEYFPEGENQYQVQLIDKLLSILNDREKDIFLRAAVNKESLSSIGKDYGISKERVRQIRDDVRMKLYTYGIDLGIDPERIFKEIGD